MTFETFKNLISKIRKMPLPGVSSHEIMAPSIREKAMKHLDLNKKSPRHAAVTLLLYPKENIMHIALILRPEYEGVHSGQVALPGGKIESFDSSYEAAALRETEEEIGVETTDVTILKSLTKVYIPPSNFWVHPFLGYIEKRPYFVLQPEEVDKIIEVPLMTLLNEANVLKKKLSTSYAKNIEVLSFELNGYTVWGATAMMLSELKVLLNNSMEL